MFTGLIEEIGVIRGIQRGGQTLILTIEASKVLEDVQLGDSIAVNGVCLTVVRYDATTMAMDVMPETYRNTTLKDLSIGSRVNLERAMAAKGRFGGHVVQGHVDGTGSSYSANKMKMLFASRSNRMTRNCFVISLNVVRLR